MEKWSKQLERLFLFLKTKNGQIFIYACFVLAFFIPRFLAHLRYGTMEDELLSMHFNLSFATKDLFVAPDHAHPPLWYVLMDWPTQILGISHVIFYYRLIQVVILFVLLSIAIFSFKNKLSKQLMLVFFALFLTNIYIVHLSFQHRMYAMMLGIAVLYSFYWYYLIKHNKDRSFWNFILLAIIAALGFFTNYAIVWLILIWPLSYLFYNKNLYVFKRLLVFATTFMLSIVFFIPTFIFNVKESVIGNTFNPSIDLTSVIRLVSDYFGLLKFGDTNRSNLLFGIFLVIFLSITIISLDYYKKTYFRSLTFATLFTFLLFLLISKFTAGRIFYARTSITFAIAFYFMIVEFYSLNKDKYLRVFVYFLILIQLSQFAFYFSKNIRVYGQYDLFNYRTNPISYFKSYSFGKNDCLMAVPDWNKLAVNFYLGNFVRVLSTTDLKFQGEGITANCAQIYILHQITVDSNITNYQIKMIDKNNLGLIFIKEYGNQYLYLLRN